MSPVKQQILKMIRSLPDSATVDDVMAELHFKMQVDAGLEELDCGRGIPHGKVTKKLSKWLKK